MGGNFRSGRAGGCGNPQAQIDFVLLAGTGLRGNAKPFFLRQMRLRGKSRLIHFKSDNPHVRSDGNVRTKAQTPRRNSAARQSFIFTLPARLRRKPLGCAAMGAKNGRVFCACARFAASSPLRRIFYRTARTTVSDCRRRRVLRTLQALRVGRRLVWSELRRGFSRTSRP